MLSFTTVSANAPKPSTNFKHISAFLLRPAQKQSTSSLSKLYVLNIKSILSKLGMPKIWDLGLVFAKSIVKVTPGRSYDALVSSSRNMVLRVKDSSFFWVTSRTAEEKVSLPNIFFINIVYSSKLFVLPIYVQYEFFFSHYIQV